MFSFSTRLVGRLHVLNLRQEAAENSDYEVTVEDIVNYENKYGKIRPGSIVSTDHWSLQQLILYNDISTCHLIPIKIKDFIPNLGQRICPGYMLPSCNEFFPTF